MQFATNVQLSKLFSTAQTLSLHGAIAAIKNSLEQGNLYNEPKLQNIQTLYTTYNTCILELKALLIKNNKNNTSINIDVIETAAKTTLLKNFQNLKDNIEEEKSTQKKQKNNPILLYLPRTIEIIKSPSAIKKNTTPQDKLLALSVSLTISTDVVGKIFEILKITNTQVHGEPVSNAVKQAVEQAVEHAATPDDDTNIFNYVMTTKEKVTLAAAVVGGAAFITMAIFCPYVLLGIVMFGPMIGMLFMRNRAKNQEKQGGYSRKKRNARRHTQKHRHMHKQRTQRN